MTKIQIKFLECIYENGKTAEELCKILKIPSNTNDTLGGCYNALNNAINYLISDAGNEIDTMFDIIPNDTPVSNKDKYVITKEGKKYIEDYRDNKRNLKKGNIIGIIGIVVAIVAIVISVIISMI